MIRISNIKVPLTELKSQTEDGQITAIKKVLLSKYRIKTEDILELKIKKRSLDARKKQEIHYNYSVELRVKQENLCLSRPNVTKVQQAGYTLPVFGGRRFDNRPVIVGMGPAGLFCGLELARAGYCPLLLERGEAVEKRIESVENFWSEGKLNDESNVQFGEGGAGTFSDGKLNTLVKDPFGRHQRVLDDFVTFGAPSEISYVNKPHIGTDRLREVVKNIRREIIRLGGEVRFETKVTELLIEDSRIKAVVVNGGEVIPCEALVLAIGHSARDTFSMLHRHQLTMQPKSFAVGLRIEHPQEMIGRGQYGEWYKKLPAADYKLTHACKNGRGVYSFCMCPGGFVVNASSEAGRLAVNGMSNYDRSEANANSALIVTVTPEDYGTDDCLAGVEFQRKWESLAFQAGKGLVPVQRFADFQANKVSLGLGGITPNIRGGYQLANLRDCLPAYISESLIEGIEAFERKIQGFGSQDALLSGVETRTSSPVRIVREETSFESNRKGIYPCGEGAGYAGGIISAAMDGIRVFEKIASAYAPVK